jgi:hypothetical protein
MAELTSGEKTLLRAGGHKAVWYLSVHKPESLLTARLNNASIERGARSIAYDNGGGTGYSSIETGQILWVGTAAGEKDKETVRIRAITGSQSSGTITVAENAIDWSDNDYLTVKYDYPIRPIWPYIASDGTFRKDGPDGDLYTNQNEQPPPVAIIGPDRCAFMDGPSVALAFDASNSYAVANGATISSYAWTFSGTGTFDDDTSPTPTLTITAGNPDGDWVMCTVTDSNTKTQITRRLVFTHDHTGSNVPYTDFRVDSLSGNWSSGGWHLRITALADATAADFPDEAMVVLWHEAWYGATEQFIGGVADKNLLFVGFIRKDTTTQTWDTGEVAFEAATVQEMLGKYMMFSVSLQAVASPSKWYEFPSDNLTAATALHHLFCWHSTLLGRADVLLPMSNTRLMPACDDFVRSAIFNQGNVFGTEHSIFAHLCCDKAGRLHAEEDIQMLSDTDRDAKTVITEIISSDWRDQITLARQIEKRVSMIQLSGFYFDGTTATPFVSKAPGDVPEDEGTGVREYERQVLGSQGQSNAICGRALALANNTFPDVRVPFHGHYLGALDLVPQEWCTLTLAATDTPRGITWTNQKLIARSITATLDPENGIILADAGLAKEAEGPDGVTSNFPKTAPAKQAPGAPTWPPGQYGSLFSFDNVNGCWFLGPNASDWLERNGDLAGVDILDLWGGTDPWWQSRQGSGHPDDAILLKCNASGIFLSKDGGQTWAEVTPATNPPNAWNDPTPPTASTVTYGGAVSHPVTTGEHFAFANWQEGVNSKWRAWLLHTTNDGGSWDWYPLGNNYLDGQVGIWTYPNTSEQYETVILGGDGDPEYTETSISNLEADDGNMATMRVDWTGKTSAAAWLDLTTFDLGGWFKLSDSRVDGGYNVKAELGTVTETMTDDDNVDFYMKIDENEVGAGSTAVLWDGSEDGFPWPSGTRGDVIYGSFNWYRAVGTTLRAPVLGGQCEGTGYISIPMDYFAIYPDEVETAHKILGMAISQETGRWLVLTTWEGEAIRIRSYDLEGIESDDWINYPEKSTWECDCTETEINNGTYIAWVVAAPDEDKYFYVFGYVPPWNQVHRFNADTAARSVIESGWGTDRCGSFHTGPSIAGNRTFSAVRNETGANKSEFHRGTNELLKVSDLIFADGVGVNPYGMTISQDDVIYLGADTAGAVMVIKAESPYTTWTDITGSALPTDGEITALEVV